MSRARVPCRGSRVEGRGHFFFPKIFFGGGGGGGLNREKLRDIHKENVMLSLLLLLFN